jgi:hypothetical protein
VVLGHAGDRATLAAGMSMRGPLRATPFRSAAAPWVLYVAVSRVRWGLASHKGAEMLKTIVGLVPLAVVLAALGAAIWWMLSRDMVLGRWILAAVMLGHGLVHAMFVMPQPTAKAGGTEWPFDMAKSWLVTAAGLDVNLVRMIGVAFIGVVVVGFMLAALATVGVVVPSGAWPALVSFSAVASAVMLVLFFTPQLLLGLAIDAVLVWVALAAVWTPSAAAS